jgi:hypothetical protein
MLDDKTLNWYNKHGLTPPSTTSHNITPEDIRNNLKRVTFIPGTWHLEGNKLTVSTEWGPLSKLHFSRLYFKRRKRRTSHT